MKELSIFEHEQFGSIRIADRDGNPWFVAKDVCDVLGIINTSQAVAALDDDERAMFNIGYQNQGFNGINQEINIISESGLYALVFKSRKPDAKKFRKWVSGEVLPSIRKTGEYHDVKEVLFKGKKKLHFAHAENLYVVKQMPLNAIEELLKVSSRTLQDWKKDGNWDEKRANYLHQCSGMESMNIEFIHNVISEVNRKYRKGLIPTDTELQVASRMISLNFTKQTIEKGA